MPYETKLVRGSMGALEMDCLDVQRIETPIRLGRLGCWHLHSSNKLD